MSWRAGVFAAAVGAAMLLTAGAAQAHPRDHRNCRARIEREEAKLVRDIRRHGFGSRQAEQRRIKLARLHRECGFSFGRFDRHDRDRRFGRGRGGIGRVIDFQIGRRGHIPRGALWRNGIVLLPTGGAVVLPGAARSGGRHVHTRGCGHSRSRW